MVGVGAGVHGELGPKMGSGEQADLDGAGKMAGWGAGEQARWLAGEQGEQSKLETKGYGLSMNSNSLCTPVM